MNTPSSGLSAKARACFAAIARFFKRIGKWYVGLYKRQPWYKKLAAALVSFFVFVVVYACAVIFNFFWLFGKSPSLDDIMHPKTAAASEIYSADGKLLGKFFSENRSPVPYDSISPVFFQALVSTEDERFYSHHGIDFKGIFAAAKDAVGGHARGASTITQQLVKNMFRVRTEYSTGLLGRVPGLDILIKKSKEMILAVGLEMFYTKREILNMYANTVDFGSNAFGIKTAAQTYFSTTPSRLKAEEAAVLVGLLKATSYYNPRINPKNSLRRRNTVLNNMKTHGRLSAAACDSLQALPIELKFKVETAYDGKALYFRQAVADYIEANCPGLDPYSDGLKIYTTLDSRMQQYAEEAVREQMKVVQRNFRNHWGTRDPWVDERGNVIPGFIEDIARRSDAYKILDAKYDGNADSINYYLNLPHKVKVFDYDGQREELMSTMDSIRYMVRFMHAGFVAMEPATGYVRAWVGDIDFASWKYDKVRAMRQPGSTFKLFVYATAMKQGLTPADRRRDEYIRMEVYDKRKGENQVWQPHNADGRFTNSDVPLRAAFARSINTIAVKLGQEVGIDQVVRTAKDMGIKSPLDETPSLALGSSDVNLLEMVNAYATVANDGMHVEPVLVTKIVDDEGETVYEAATDATQALPYRAAFFMQQLLEAGTHDGGGTSLSLGRYVGRNNRSIDYGGKTGTSNNHSDAWFIGVTPALVGGAWVGGEYRSIHFRTGALGQGSRTALPIFGLFLEKVLADNALRNRYLKTYPAPKESIDPALYEAAWAPPAAPADTTETDSLELDFQSFPGSGSQPAEGGESLMDEPGDGENAAPSAPAEARPASEGTEGGTPQPRRHPARQQKDADDLFN